MSSYRCPFGTVPFTTREARAVGLSPEDLQRLVATRELRRVLRGVYVAAGVPDSLELRAAAVARAAPAHRVVCLRTAAWLWRADVQAMGAHLEIPPVDLMAPSGAAGPRRDGCRGCVGRLPRDDVVELYGVLVTTPARTAADLARLLNRPDALAALDALMRVTQTAKGEVARVLARFGRARGVVQGRELLGLSDSRAESPQESRTRLRCVDAGFPLPEPQIEVFDATGALLARLDMGYRAVRKAIEFDGHDAHSTVAQQRHDRARRERVGRRGWQVLVVTTEHVQGRGLAFERAVGELLGREARLTRHHPRYGGWDRGLLGRA